MVNCSLQWLTVAYNGWPTLVFELVELLDVTCVGRLRGRSWWREGGILVHRIFKHNLVPAEVIIKCENSVGMGRISQCIKLCMSHALWKLLLSIISYMTMASSSKGEELSRCNYIFQKQKGYICKIKFCLSVWNKLRVNPWPSQSLAHTEDTGLKVDMSTIALNVMQNDSITSNSCSPIFKKHLQSM